MENGEHVHRSSLPSWTTAELPQEENGEAGAEHFSVEELFNFACGDDYAVLPVDNDNGGSKAAKDQCFADSSSPVSPPLPFCNNSPSNTPYSDQLTCRYPLHTGLPGGLPETHSPEHSPEPDWMSLFELEVYSSVEEELQKQELSILDITATPSQPNHQVEYLFNNEAAVYVETTPPFTTELTAPDKAVKSTHKRARDTECTWSPHLDPTTESSSLVHSDAGFLIPDPVTPPPSKMKKRERSPDGVSRRCQHCGTESTPQWRVGPTGPQSLCNPCGIRYKSGRLLPEYRPASSPTFAVSEHSNSHRKVCNIRRQKGLPTEPYPPVNNGLAMAREWAATTELATPGPGHNSKLYLYLPHFLHNF